MNRENDFSNTFHQEAKSLMEEIESSLLDLEASPKNKEFINALFRAVHTLKGNSGMFGYDRIAKLGHLMENIIGSIRDQDLDYPAELSDLFLFEVDIVRALLDKKEVSDIQFEEAKDRLEKFAMPSLNKDKNQSSGKFHIYFRPMNRIFQLGMDPVSNLAELMELGECEIKCNLEDIPELSDMDPETSYLSWDIDIKTEASFEELQDVFLFVADESEVIIESLDEISAESVVNKIDEPESVHPESVHIDKLLGRITGADSSIVIPTRKLDNMVNLVGELVMYHARLLKETEDRDLPVKNIVWDLEEAVQHLRSAVLDLRMTPIGSKFGHFRRLVRDISSSLGKKTELFTYGEDTEIDKTLVEKIMDPVVHILRNSIDHGIEPPEERVAEGKSATGRIVISARTKDSRVELSISDDGRGIDERKVFDQAVKKGFISEEKSLTINEIVNFIFIPGFSTSGSVSEISGRGVGMDVVKQKIEDVNGEITVLSEKGEGTTILLSLPLTLAIVDVLLVEAGGMNFIISVDAVEECLDFEEYRVVGERDRHLVCIRGKYYPYVRLKDILELDSAEYEGEEQIMLVSYNEHIVGLVVDRLVRAQQAVIKSMKSWYKCLDGISGATVLGDGSLAYVIDVAQIIKNGFVRDEAALVSVFES